MKDFLGGTCPKYNEIRDSQEVEQGLSVDITAALKTGIVRDPGTPMDSNGIDDCEAIVGRVENTFDAIEAARAVKKYGKKAKMPTTPTEPSPTPTPSANPSVGE